MYIVHVGVCVCTCGYTSHVCVYIHVHVCIILVHGCVCVHVCHVYKELYVINYSCTNYYYAHTHTCTPPHTHTRAHRSSPSLLLLHSSWHDALSTHGRNRTLLSLISPSVSSSSSSLAHTSLVQETQHKALADHAYQCS